MPVRTKVQDRSYRTFTYQDVDRVLDIEFGYWPQTIRRWLAEGMPLDLTRDETEQMFSRKVDDHFGLEHMEDLSYAFYDYPDMVHDIVIHWAELCAR